MREQVQEGRGGPRPAHGSENLSSHESAGQSQPAHSMRGGKEAEELKMTQALAVLTTTSPALPTTHPHCSSSFKSSRVKNLLESRKDGYFKSLKYQSGPVCPVAMKRESIFASLTATLFEKARVYHNALYFEALWLQELKNGAGEQSSMHMLPQRMYLFTNSFPYSSHKMVHHC